MSAPCSRCQLPPGEAAGRRKAASSRSAASAGVSVPSRTCRSSSGAEGGHLGVGAQLVEHRVPDHRPHPADLLAAAPARPARRTRRGCPGGATTCSHTSASPVPSRALQVSTGGCQPSPRPRSSRSAPASSRAAALASVAVRAVGLVDRDHVGQLEHALLDALQLVAGAGQRQQQERVDHLGDGGLGLADADGLDQDDVVAGRLDHHHRLAGGLGDAAERAGGRRRADERGRVDGQPGHPGLVAEDAAAGAGRRRVDGEHRDPVAGRGQLGAERVDERRLADAGHAGDADPPGLAGVRGERDEQLLRRRPVVGRVDSTSVMARAIHPDRRDPPRHRPCRRARRATAARPR